MLKDTFTSTTLTSDAYAAINVKILESIRDRLRLRCEIRPIGNELTLELAKGHRLEAKVVLNGQGIPHSSIRIKSLGVPEGGQYPTWTIEQCVQGRQGSVIFASYRRPNHFFKEHLTLDESVSPEGVPVDVGAAGSLLRHIIEVVPLATKPVT